MFPRPIDEMVSPEKRLKQLEDMRQLSEAFYYRAVQIGCHPFIEFNGLMNEWIKMAEDANRQGMDFNVANTHSGMTLPMPSYSVDYINDKLDCIFLGASVMSHKLPQEITGDERLKKIADMIAEAKRLLDVVNDTMGEMRNEEGVSLLAIQEVGGAALHAREAIDRAIRPLAKVKDPSYTDPEESHDDEYTE